MKNNIITKKNIIGFLYLISGLIFSKITFATDGGILGKGGKLRNGTIELDDIPEIIAHAIDFFIGIAGTISVIFIIIGAYQILFGSISQDKTKGRNTIIAAIGGFTLAALAWFIVKIIISNFG